MRYAVNRKVNANPRLMFDTRIRLKDGTYTVKLEVAYGSKKRRFVTGVKMTCDQWGQMNLPGLQDKFLRKQRDVCEKSFVKARKIIEEMSNEGAFDFDQFAYKYAGNIPKEIEDRMDVYLHFDEYARKLRRDERIGTAVVYEKAAESLKQFRPVLTFAKITPKFLNEYEKWMLKRGKSYTTIGMYMRDLRAIVNIGIANKLMNNDDYPFGLESKGLYEIPVGSNIKQALEPETLKKILTYKPISLADEWYIGLWLFSFYCNGMNVADILNLKYENIADGRIYFYRQKTKRSIKKNLQPVMFLIPDQIKPFIEKFGQKDKDPQSYVFDVYKSGMSAEERHHREKTLIRAITRSLSHMKKRLAITTKVNLMACRHTWSTVMMNEYAPITYMSKGLGHTSIKTTENYLAQFNRKKLEEMNDRFRNFTDRLVASE